MSRHRSYNSANPFLFSDSVPDLSTLNNENHINSGISTNHSTPKKIPYSSNPNGNNNTNVNGGRYSNGYGSQNNSYSSNGFYGSPRRILMNSFGSNNVVDEEDESEVQLRRPRHNTSNNDNGNDEKDWMYRKPKGPNDNRHSGKNK